MVFMIGLDIIGIGLALFLLVWLIANLGRYMHYLSQSGGGWFLGLSDYLIRKSEEKTNKKESKR
jgi:hypothetical protein